MRSLESILKEHDFYESSTRRVMQFSAQALGTPHIDRALDGKSKYWYGPAIKNTASTVFKKVLIIHPVDSSGVLKFYENLLEAGVELYVWQGQAIRCRSPYHLKLELKKAIPCEDKNVNYKILDYYETTKIRMLLQGKSQTGSCPLDFYDINGPGDRRDYANKISVLGRPYDAIFNLNAEYVGIHAGLKVLDIAPLDSEKEADLIGRLFKEIITSQSYADSIKKIGFTRTAPHFVQVFLRQCQLLEDLTLLQPVFNERFYDTFIKDTPKLNRLKKLCIGNDIHFFGYEAYEDMLQCFPNLEFLKLIACNQFGLWLSNYGKNAECLAELRCFDLSGSDFSISQLETLIEACPQLEFLRLSSINLSENFSTNFEKNPCLLEQLETLDLSQSNISFEGLQVLLRSCPNLEHLNLEGCQNLFQPFSEVHKIPCLMRLKTLNLEEARIYTSQEFEALIDLGPNVEELNLIRIPISGSDISHRILSRNGRCFPKLKKLKTSFPIKLISESDVPRFIEIYPNLESYQYLFYSGLGAYNRLLLWVVSNKKRLISLRSLSLINKGFYEQQVSILLDCCPNVETLDFINLRIFDGSISELFLENQESLKKLTSLNLSMTLIDKAELARILKCCPNLKHLIISSCASLELLPEDLEFLAKNILYFEKDNPEFFKANKNDQQNKIPRKKRQSPEKNIDIQTVAKPRTHEVNRYFDGPLSEDYSHYRLAVKTANLKYPNKIQSCAFEKTENAKAFQASISGSHRGFVQLDLNEEWQALPSLMAYDAIKAIQCDVPLELGFNAAESLYYVRTKKACGMREIEWVVEQAFPLKSEFKPEYFDKTEFLPKIDVSPFSSLSFDEKGNLQKTRALDFLRNFNPDEQLILLGQYFKAFGEGELKGVSEKSPYYQKINAILHQGKGSCRHRAEAFFEICRALGVSVRLIENDCHEFCEIQYKNTWYRMDLGGYPGHLKVNDLFQKEKSSKSLFAEEEAPKNILSEEGLDPSIFPSLMTPCPPEIQDNPSYAKWLQKQSANKLLLCYESLEQVDGLVDSLHENACAEKGRIFYLDDLDELTYQSLALGEDAYEIVESALLNFVKNAKPGDTLVIREEKFRAEHIGYYNSVFDKMRRLGVHNIPECLKIIMLIPRSAARRFGPDFYSRFECITEYTLSSKSSVSSPSSAIPLAKEEIKLYGSGNWQERLLGRPHFYEKNIRYWLGKLDKALGKKSKDIFFINPPDSREFDVFYRELLEARRYFSNGKMHEIPDDVKFHIETRPYSHGKKEILHEKLCEENSKDWDVVLNSSTLAQFYQKFHSEDGALRESLGFLKQYENKTLRVLLSADLSEGEWAELYEKSAQFNCTLICVDGTDSPLPSQPSPQELTVSPKHSTSKLTDSPKLSSHKLTGSPELSSRKLTGSPKSSSRKSRSDYPGPRNSHRLIITNDDDYVADLLHKSQEADVILSVSPETEVSALLGQFSFEKTPDLRFPFKEGALIRLLKAKKNVVLKGELSSECESALASLFSKEPYLWVNGEFFKPKRQVTILTEKKETMAFVKNREEISYEKKNGLGFSQKKLQETQSLSPAVKIDENPEAFDADRLAKITQILKTDRALLMIGPTASGKSTLVAKKLFKQEGVHGHVGLDQIKAFAKDRRPGKKRLFLDEVNLLDPAVLSLLEGFFSPTPGFLIDQKWYPLSPDHEIIGACNPLDYGGRSLHPLWDRYVKTMNFDPLPLWYIQKRIIDPLSKELKLSEENRQSIIERLQKNANLTPRNIQQEILELSIAEVKGDEAALKLSMQEEDYILTHKRMPVMNVLLKHLRIRDLKIQNSALQDQGLNACILEGDAGVGKSHMIEALLKTLGFQKGSFEANDSNPGKQYYIISSADLVNLDSILIRAFHQGALVIFDEFNTLPEDVERLLNTLLSGTDLDNNPPENPGFYIFGTQNPPKSEETGIEYSSRKKASKALANRCDKINVPVCEQDELIELFCNMALKKSFAERFAKDFERSVTEAISKGALIIPTVRDAIKMLHAETPNILALKLYLAIEERLQKNETELVGCLWSEIMGLLEKGSNPNITIKNGQSCHELLMQAFGKKPGAPEMAALCLAHTEKCNPKQLNFYSEPSRKSLLENAFSKCLGALGSQNRSLLQSRKSKSALAEIAATPSKNSASFFAGRASHSKPNALLPFLINFGH